MSELDGPRDKNRATAPGHLRAGIGIAVWLTACHAPNPNFSPRSSTDAAAETRSPDAERAMDTGRPIDPGSDGESPRDGNSGGTGGSGGASGSGGSGGESPPEAGAPEVPPPDAGAPPPDMGAPADTTSTPPPDLAPGQGPISYWRFDDPAGTVVRDETGRNPGQLKKQAACTDGGFTGAGFSNPRALTLDGVDDYVDLGTSALPAVDAAKTVSAWFYVAAKPIGRRYLFSLTNIAAANGIHIGTQDGKAAVWRWATSDTLVVSGKDVVPGWHHVAYTCDGTVHTIYLDGIRGEEVLGTRLPAGVVREARVGTYDPAKGTAEMWKGRVDDLRIYDHALSATEVADLAAGKP